MEKTCLIVAGVLATVLAVAAQDSPGLYGTCASIGYSTSCCPRGADCQATDGNCNCGADCYHYGDCCQDVYCPSNPRTCVDVGITSCCTDEGITGACEVHRLDHSYCTCNMSCHLRNDCCDDVETIGCVPQTCYQAGKDPGCCKWTLTSSCYVGGSRCYCDKYCTYQNDCCDDVTEVMTSQCGYAEMARSGARAQTNRNRMLRPSPREIFNEKEFQTNTRRVNANGRQPMATHRQRSHINSREFKARARHAT